FSADLQHGRADQFGHAAFPPLGPGVLMRLGVDVGGSKVEVALLDRQGRVALRQRAATPQGSYEAAVHGLWATILAVEGDAGEPCTVRVGIPGALSPRSGLVQNAYNTPLNGRPLKSDLEAALARGVRLANDANCFALSEALDGAARGARVVFGAILGTGAGGGIAVDRRILEGRNAIGRGTPRCRRYSRGTCTRTALRLRCCGRRTARRAAYAERRCSGIRRRHGCIGLTPRLRTAGPAPARRPRPCRARARAR